MPQRIRCWPSAHVVGAQRADVRYTVLAMPPAASVAGLLDATRITDAVVIVIEEQTTG